MWMIPEKHEFHSDIVLCCYWLSALSYSFLIGWLEWAELCSRLSCVHFAVYRELLCLLLAVSCSVLLFVMSSFVLIGSLCRELLFSFVCTRAVKFWMAVCLRLLCYYWLFVVSCSVLIGCLSWAAELFLVNCRELLCCY